MARRQNRPSRLINDQDISGRCQLETPHGIIQSLRVGSLWLHASRGIGKTSGLKEWDNPYKCLEELSDKEMARVYQFEGDDKPQPVLTTPTVVKFFSKTSRIRSPRKERAPVLLKLFNKYCRTTLRDFDKQQDSTHAVMEPQVMPVASPEFPAAPVPELTSIPVMPQAEVTQTSALQLFQHPDFGRVRVLMKDGDPWFVARDVCECLGLGNPHTSLALLDEDEKGIHTVDTLGGEQSLSILSESGLYSLILRSRKPEAKAFKRWVTHDVLPSIRRTGSYSMDVRPSSFFNLSVAELRTMTPKMLRVLAEQAEKLLELEEKRSQTLMELEAVREARLRDAPKVLYAEASEASGTEMSVGAYAFFFRQKSGQPVGRNKMFEVLVRHGFLLRTGDRTYPYRPAGEAAQKGWLTVVETLVPVDGTKQVFCQVMVTAAGRQNMTIKLLDELDSWGMFDVCFRPKKD